MGRHNRDAVGADQQGFGYTVSYPPDWLSHIKVTRLLESGRQSTMMLVRNDEPPAQSPGRQVRTRIRSHEQGLDVNVVLREPGNTVVRVTVDVLPEPDRDASADDVVRFTLYGHHSPEAD